eukprot:g2322.t1
MDWRHELLMNAVAQELAEGVSTWSQQNLANILWAFAKVLVQPRPARAIQAVAEDVLLTLNAWSALNMANLTWALAKLALRHERLYSAIDARGRPGGARDETTEHECQQKLWHFSPQNLVNVAWAFAKVLLVRRSFFEELGTCATQLAPDFNPQNCSNADQLDSRGKETHNTGGFRGVMMIRDPVDMVISAYSYHHRGAEPDSIYAQGMVELTPAEGVPAMASRMLDTVEVMVQAAKNAEPDVMLVSFERMTKSSASFNQTVQDMVEFLFTDEISKLDQQPWIAVMTDRAPLLSEKESCQYGGMGAPITFYTPEHTDCAEHPSSIRFDNHIDAGTISELRKETQNTGGFHGVMMIRDPVDMVISAYSYHHRGAEPDNTYYSMGMPELNPGEGIPVMAVRMLPIVFEMVQAAKKAEPEVMVVSFEKMTKSSANFNHTVQEIVNFLFTDEITKLDQQEILNRAVQEDLHRGYNGLSSIPSDHFVNHTNDPEDMELAKKAWQQVPAFLSAEYQRLRKELGYA